MKELSVQTPEKCYNIYFSDTFEPLATILEAGNYSKIAIVSETNVFPLYGEALKKVCQVNPKEVYSYTYIAGEANKNIDTLVDLYDFCVSSKLDRNSIVLALGGGVTGDMVGFLSATFMRGIAYGQIPTSLLAQVDSSVGGKTGIDFNGYKNIIGAFYQPEFVFMNTNTLKTLNQREFSSGMGEIIKHGCILDKDYLNMLINEREGIVALEHNALTNMIIRSCEIKSKIVGQDEKERGIRALLNFGHTFGHAVERLIDFKLSHGACVSIGMVAASYLSLTLNYIQKEDYDLIIDTIISYGLPISIDGILSSDVYNDMFSDKKTAYNQLKLVLLRNLGDAFITTDVKKEDIIKAIEHIIKK
ncbi:MAG: 3-dehydroquinate synthase [Vallitaleaceae bacterium]|jgi:3-dehydroquinate synthase|nr:3-dehydroquinate synthase [Vallitaleaceae bacterium]